jgi:ATP-dependent exoDNAse (exonuclease V) alpha subunit
VIIDEAGMADALSLDTAVDFIVRRGGSVRLVGDDQQLAAIGAGGVLRDIKHKHGALRLTELHRFTDPAEAAASLVLREGKPEALDFYLDHGPFMSATSPPQRRMPSRLGLPTKRPGSTRS